MADGKRVPRLEGLIDEILAMTHGSSRQKSVFANAAEEIKTIAQRDYSGPVRKWFGRSEVCQLISEAKRTAWPRLNEEPVRLASPKEFTKAWSPLGIEIRLAKFSSAHGSALLGFYVRKNSTLGRPLICVNTAHHLAVIGAAFAHEMGHHLTSEIFGLGSEPHFLLYTGYGDHLDDPQELAADLMVSVGVYPQRVARKAFDKVRRPVDGRPQGRRGSDYDFNEMLDYFAERYGLDFKGHSSPANRLQYLAGIIHYTKLRQALLNEYDL